jgi:hypothetical protein
MAKKKERNKKKNYSEALVGHAAEIKRTVVGGQPEKIVHEIPSAK